MRPSLIKTPVLNQLYTQKLNLEAHKRKLELIKEQRKSHLNDPFRKEKLMNIRDSKSKSFAHRFNQETDRISRQNLRFLARLESANSSLPRKLESKSLGSLSESIVRRQQSATERENQRIVNRLSSLSSSLNQKTLLKDFTRSQQIKARIMRYAVQQNQVHLKSESFLRTDRKLNDSVTHSRNRAASDVSEKQAGRNIASLYRKEDILRNKVMGSTRLRDLARYQSSHAPKNSSFFSTEPRAVRNRKSNY